MLALFLPGFSGFLDLQDFVVLKKSRKLAVACFLLFCFSRT
jgi:hypothetical protein